MARFSQSLVADEERFSGCTDEFGCEGVEVVEALDACDLGEEPVDEAEVAAGAADDGRDGGGVSDPSAAVSAVGCRRVRTAVSSSGVRGRYSWAKPMRL